MGIHKNITSNYYNGTHKYPVYNDVNYESLRKAYYEERARLNEQFKSDLFNEFHVSENPKAELCFEKALSFAKLRIPGRFEHSDVFDYFSEMVELIK